MIVPSIDLQDGQAVQLVGGRELEIEAGDPRPIAQKFGRVGEVAVIDLDAAMGKGNNASLVRELMTLADCRIGGGIRSVEKAVEWLDAGAAKVILGTAATPEILSQLPKERTIAALDAYEDEVVVEGWQTKTGTRIEDRILELRDLVGGFLITFVEKEGRMQGTRMDRVQELVDSASPARVTFAGGITTAEEIREIDRLGADAQVGMALYSGSMSLAAGFAASLRSDRTDGLWPTIVCDERGAALGLAYSNIESLEVALERGIGAYHSRKRGLWIKGETSGSTQELLRVDADCDRDTLRFTVRQEGAFCHLGTRTCFGEAKGLGRLAATLQGRQSGSPDGSYTARLFADESLLNAKLQEEAQELGTATSADEAAAEAADLIFFAMTKAIALGASLADIEAVLDRRALKVTRRAGDRKN